MKRPMLLDLCCKAGGASFGYHQAGFRVVGIDVEPQPNYPFEFFQKDIRKLNPDWIRKHFKIVTGSPPCQFHSVLNGRNKIEYQDLIPDTRVLMIETGLPYVIENVEGARKSLIKPIQLCGSSFGLRVRRHRLFESNVRFQPPACCHEWQDRSRVYVKRIAKNRGEIANVGVVPVFGTRQLHGDYYSMTEEHLIASTAMGIDWMTYKELTQAIPPAFTYWLGRKLRKLI